MSPMRPQIALVTLLLLAGCRDAVAPAAAPPPGPPPHLLVWSSSGASQFSAVVDRPGRAVAFLSGPAAPQAETPSTSGKVNASKLTWQHPVGFEANRLLVVGVAVRHSSHTVTALTYAGVPLTFLGARNNDDGDVRLELWYLTAPASGTAPISVTLSGHTEFVAGATTFYGVDQATPLSGFVTNASTGRGSSDPSVVVTNGAGGLVIATLAAESSPGVLTSAAGQQTSWTNLYTNKVVGAGAFAPGAPTVTMGWTKSRDAEWAIGAAVVNAAPWTGPPLDQFQVSFWAVRGQPSSVLINYLDSIAAPQPFLQLDVTDPTFVPGRGNLAVGDSVLLTVTVDPVHVLVQLEPSGVQFGQPSALSIWYGGAGGDLNGDGVADSTDANIEGGLLKVFYQEEVADPWTDISSVQSASNRTFTAQLQHFSRYAVAW